MIGRHKKIAPKSDFLLSYKEHLLFHLCADGVEGLAVALNEEFTIPNHLYGFRVDSGVFYTLKFICNG